MIRALKSVLVMIKYAFQRVGSRLDILHQMTAKLA